MGRREKEEWRNRKKEEEGVDARKRWVGLVASHEDWSVFDRPARRRTRMAGVLDRSLMVVQSLNLRRRESLSTNVIFDLKCVT